MSRYRQRRESLRSLSRTFSSPFEPAKESRINERPEAKLDQSLPFDAPVASVVDEKAALKGTTAHEGDRKHQPPTELQLTQTASIDEKANAEQGPTVVYHIYHSGHRVANFNIHTIPDKDAILPQVDDPLAPNYIEHETLKNYKPSLLKRMSTLGMAGRQVKGPRVVTKAAMLKDLRLDFRTATAPYYVHHPQVGAKLVPLTLRRGGSKQSPTACLISGYCFWRKYRITLDDRLAQEGVIDGRGVVSAKYGTKKGKNGTLKGHKFKKRRGFDSGKDWSKQEMARRKALKAEGKFVKDDWTEPITPEEIVWLKWKSPFSNRPRNYYFNWSGFDFCWKGTSMVRDAKFMGHLVGFSHLKLIVKIPHPGDDDKESLESGKPQTKNTKTKSTKLCLAMYTCLVAGRKAGRLEVFRDVIDGFCERYLVDHEGASGTASPLLAKKRQRLNDLVIATVICMIRSEAEKRELIMELLITAAENAGS